MVAQIAEVEVNRETGHVWAKRLVCAHDCGLVVNPQSLRHTIECAMLHGLSRALHEEVQFDTQKVTSVDWITHPSLTHADTPAQIDVVLVNGLLGACWDVHAFAVPILGHERGFSAATIGLVLGVFPLSVTGVRLLIPLIAHRMEEARVLRRGGQGVLRK